MKPGGLSENSAASTSTVAPALFAALLTAGLLMIVQFKVPRPMLIVDRFFPGFGWIEIAALAAYAAFLAPKIADDRLAPVWRPRIWRLFTIVFFGQLLLGLVGFERFLMTGKLHLPVPALIVSGPLYRGEGLFMPILFASTVLLVGPAWCSYLCYIGAWDDAASRAAAKPKPLPAWRRKARVAILLLAVAAPLILRFADIPPSVALWPAAAFGAAGIDVMLSWSRKTGQMTHCTTWCPIGLVANVAGKINPFRIRIDEKCTECRLCIPACRYDALSLADIQRRKPGLSCTLCGDCVGRCRHSAMRYGFIGLGGGAVRTVFAVLVVSLHASFLGLARL